LLQQTLNLSKIHVPLGTSWDSRHQCSFKITLLGLEKRPKSDAKHPRVPLNLVGWPGLKNRPSALAATTLLSPRLVATSRVGRFEKHFFQDTCPYEFLGSAILTLRTVCRSSRRGKRSMTLYLGRDALQDLSHLHMAAHNLHCFSQRLAGSLGKCRFL